MKSIKLNRNNSKLLGRTLDGNGILRLIQSGTGAEFVFTGKKLKITIGCDEYAFRDNARTNFPRAAILVDGRFIVKKVIENRREEYIVIDSPVTVTKTVRIIKLSEAAFSIAEVMPIETDDAAYIFPAPEKSLKIEIIGDSITCGYGVDDSNIQSDFATEAENCMKAYSYLTAQLLDADYSLFCYSGHGLISGYTPDETRNTREVIPPEYYDTYGYSYGCAGDQHSHEIPWDHRLFKPNVILINLGTNDDSYCQKNSAAYDEYTEKLTIFLRKVRSRWPDAHIIFCLGIIPVEIYPYAVKAVRQLHDDKIYTFKFKAQNGWLGYGSNWHPSEDTHKCAAEEISAFIKTIINK